MINQIEANTPFEELANDYTCPLCESPKEHFQEIELETTK
ncbi:MAG: rubredoxin [Bacteroidota bacterium]